MMPRNSLTCLYSRGRCSAAAALLSDTFHHLTGAEVRLSVCLCFVSAVVCMCVGERAHLFYVRVVIIIVMHLFCAGRSGSFIKIEKTLKNVSLWSICSKYRGLIVLILDLYKLKLN